MQRSFASAALAALFVCGPAAAQTLLSNGDYSGGPLTTDRAWQNGQMNHSEWRHVHATQYFDTIAYDPKKDPGASGLTFPEFRAVLSAEFQQADRNGNGVIDSEAERCLLHRTPDGAAAGGMGLRAADLGEATVQRQRYIASRRTWEGPDTWTGSGEWPIDQEYADLAGKDHIVTWSDIPGCAFMADANAEPPAAVPTRAAATPGATVTGAAPTGPVESSTSCKKPTRAEATRLVFTAWSDSRLTAQEADSLNRGRHCQLDANSDGSVSEAEFLAQSLADFDRADRNKDGVLSGQREIGALANPGSPVAAGFSRQQAQDLSKLRFAILDRKPRDGGLSLEEYLAVTAEEFARNDVDKDGALTAQEAARQSSAQ